jgi:hypothetical protein
MRRKLELRSYRTAVYPEPAEPRKSPGRKDTKRWCRGKVGAEHSREWICDARFPLTGEWSWWILACARCGRHLDFCSRSQRACRCGHHRAA